MATCDRAFGEWKGHHQGGEASADSSVTPARLGDRDGIVVEGHPGAAVDLDAGLIGIPQSVNLQPQRSYGISLRRGNREAPANSRAVCP